MSTVSALSSAPVSMFGGDGSWGEDGAGVLPQGVDLSGLAGRFGDGTMGAFTDTMSAVRFCSHPVKLHGSSVRVDRATGEVLDTYTSTSAPLGVLYRACGNRRTRSCPSCARVYARDTFALIHAGVAGGKTVPDVVSDNPLLFVTLTAPSFGTVHGVRSNSGRCHPRARSPRCRHGRQTSCMTVHAPEDERVGEALCRDCYDYQSAVLWQWHAPELWRRFTITLRRGLAARLGVPAGRLGDVASVQYAKVGEYQARGMVHFHALIRIDGPAADGIGSPAPTVPATALVQLVQNAASSVQVTTESVDQDDPGRVLAFGAQIDARIVRHGRRTDDPSGPLTPGQVAGYLAKYATKDAGTLPNLHRPHLRAMRRTTADLAGRAAAFHDDPCHDYRRMGNWVHALGFRGHFASKSRRYSITMGALRRARVRWQALAAESRRTGEPIDTTDLDARLLADADEDTTLVVGSWSYAGTGWRDPAEQALATAAACRAMEYQQRRAHDKTAKSAV